MFRIIYIHNLHKDWCQLKSQRIASLPDSSTSWGRLSHCMKDSSLCCQEPCHESPSALTLASMAAKYTFFILKWQVQNKHRQNKTLYPEQWKISTNWSILYCMKSRGLLWHSQVCYLDKTNCCCLCRSERRYQSRDPIQTSLTLAKQTPYQLQLSRFKAESLPFSSSYFSDLRLGIKNVHGTVLFKKHLSVVSKNSKVQKYAGLSFHSFAGAYTHMYKPLFNMVGPYPQDNS